MAEELMTGKKKSRYKGYTPQMGKANQKYMKEHLDDIKFRVRKGKKDYYKACAEAAGLSFTQFIIKAMDEKIERDDLAPKPRVVDI